MKQPFALTVTLALSLAALVGAAPPNPRPAVPAIGDPVYAVKGGGFKAEGAGVAERCKLPAAADAKIPLPPKSADMGNDLCKHHVWQLLETDQPWNGGRYVSIEAWGKLSASEQRQKLVDLKSYFQALDNDYKGVLDSARAVVAAYGDKDGDAKIWDAKAAKAGPALAAFYDALLSLETFINDGAFRKDKETPPATLPAKGAALVSADMVVLKMLKAADEVLGDQLVSIAAEVETARAHVAGGAAPAADVGRADQTVKKKVSDWGSALKGGDMDAALRTAFDASAPGGQGVVTGKPMLIETQDKRRFAALPVAVEGPDKTRVPTFKYAEIKPDSTMESVSKELVDNIRYDRNFKSTLSGLADAAADAARHPARTAKETAESVAKEQGPFAFMSGQTRPDMERKIEADRSKKAALAGDEFTKTGEGLQKEFEAAWGECGRKWDETEKEELYIGKLAEADRPAALADLARRREKLTVAGPSEDAKKERAPVPCTKDREPIKVAYREARGRAEDALEAKKNELTALAGLEKGQIDEKIKVRSQLRRQYFRDELLKAQPKLEAMIPSFVPAETRKKIVANHLAQTYPNKDGKFYLPSDWAMTTPAPPAEADFGKWAEVESKDPYKTAKEDAFIEMMAQKFPYMKETVFNSAPPPDDDVVRPDAQQKIAADFQDWFEAKNRKDDKGPKAPDLAKVERKPAAAKPVGK